jgi:hypothetical protein
MTSMFNDRPKTIVASQIKYNQNELYYPEGQDRFFVDFNKWTISTTIKSTEVSLINLIMSILLHINSRYYRLMILWIMIR